MLVELMGGVMIIHTTRYRLAVLVSFIVVAWLLFLIDVLPADVAVSASFIVILCALAPVGGRLLRSQDQSD